MSSVTRVVVLGGGYAGVEAVKVLQRAFRGDDAVEVSLIDRHPYQTMMTELHEVAGGRTPAESVQISFEKIFAGARVTLVTDRIRTVDFDAQELVSDHARYPYDYLILGVGGEPEFHGIPGIRETALPLWSLEDAIRIRRRVEDVFRRAAGEPDSRRRAELLTFVVAGAGFTGVELAGELANWRPILCERHHVDEAEVRIVVVEALDAVVPTLPRHLQKVARRRIERLGVEFMLQSPIVGAGPDGVRLKGGGCIPCATFVWTCGIQGAEFAANLPLTKGKCSNRLCTYATTTRGTCGVKDCEFGGGRYVEGKRGRLLVDDCMRSPDHANVYVVGDVAWYLEGKRVLPQIVETAVQTGAAAAHNVVAAVRGQPQKPFRSNYRGLMVSLGAFTGVAHVMGISLTGILAMGVKHAINVLHQFGVAGVNQVWGYLRSEFLDVSNGRSFLGGHFSAVTRGYWVAILRVFLGVMWLIEGIGKVSGGWLTPGRIFIIPVAAADGTAAASEAAAAAPAVAAAADATAAASQAVEAAASGAAAAAAAGAPVPLLAHPLGIYTWVVDTVISHAPFLFQVLIVLAELGIGLALLGGLFTFMAAVASIGLCLVFIAGSMAGKEILWYIAAAIVMLGGAGRAFGLDHWVMPWLQRLWNRTRFARRTFLYVGEPGRRSGRRAVAGR
jgi:NADH dehydrogenase